MQNELDSQPRRLRVLIAEDELVSQVILESLLSKFGACDVAGTGSEAIVAFESALRAGNRYDLICMDVRMPGLDGTKALEQIREIEGREGILSSDGVIVFMTTALKDLETIKTAFNRHCDDYLSKPIDGAELEERLRTFGLLD